MSHFRVIEHVVKCQHTRDRPAGAELGRENDLRLHVKQYVPKINENASPGDVTPGDVTIIGAQANGFPKEIYEPFWDDVFEGLQRRGRRVRGIWIADIASQGRSGILNERLLGPDASWWDHGRDLLFLINQFQDEIRHPIIGVGHSVGGAHLAHLALLHPRLLHSLVLVDPIIQRDLSPHKAFARLSSSRRDTWPSRRAAAEKFRSNKFYQNWDSRVLDKWIEYGLREIPTEKYPEAVKESDSDDVPVTLATTTEQEVYFYLRALYPEKRLLQNDDDLQRDIHPDDRIDFPFGRPETQELYRRLPEFKPSVLYVFGNQSPASPLEYRLDKVSRTGTGIGGSGGATNGRVQEVVLDCGHLVAMEKPTECADATVSFMDRELNRWDVEEYRRSEAWNELRRRGRVDINDLWRENLDVGAKAEENSKSSKL